MIIPERVTWDKNSVIIGFSTFLNALKYPQIHVLKAMKGRERDINIIIEVSFKPFKRIREIFSLKNIVS